MKYEYAVMYFDGDAKVTEYAISPQQAGNIVAKLLADGFTIENIRRT